MITRSHLEDLACASTVKSSTMWRLPSSRVSMTLCREVRALASTGGGEVAGEQSKVERLVRWWVEEERWRSRWWVCSWVREQWEPRRRSCREAREATREGARWVKSSWIWSHGMTCFHFPDK